MNLSAELNEFYTSLEDISIVNHNLDSKRSELNAIIHRFNQRIQDTTIDQVLVDKHEQLGKQLEDTIVKLKSTSQGWADRFEVLLDQEKFRSDLENYFIIMIFGKVKAGKSSLGNFIAKNNTTGKKACFFKYDEAGNEQAIKELEEIDDQHAFATDNLECTVEIQGFKMSGLAWIDTPGLGSMEEKNGALAKKYIQSADYIIYPTSSNAPLQQDEQAQLCELSEQKKNVTICITKSDTTEKKKDSNGQLKRDACGKIAKFLVNKSEQDRKAQEDFVKHEVGNIYKGKGSKIGDIFSISVHTASKALETQDDDLLSGSHLLKFYALMTDVIKKKATKLKAETPYNGLLSFIDNGLLSSQDNKRSVEFLESLLSSLDKEVQKTKEQFETIKVNINSDITAEVDCVVSRHAVEINKSNSEEIFAFMDEQLMQRISTIINENINDILRGFNSSLSSLDTMLGQADTFKIQDEYKDIKVWYEDRDWLNKLTLGVLGSSKSCVKETVHVGDNKEQMILQYKQDRTQAYVKSATDNYEQVDNTFFKPVAEVSQYFQQEIQQLKQDVIHYKANLEG